MRFEVDVTELAVVLELDTEPANLDLTAPRPRGRLPGRRRGRDAPEPPRRVRTRWHVMGGTPTRGVSSIGTANRRKGPLRLTPRTAPLPCQIGSP